MRSLAPAAGAVLAVVEAELDAMVRDGIAEKTDALYGDRWCLR